MLPRLGTMSRTRGIVARVATLAAGGAAVAGLGAVAGAHQISGPRRPWPGYRFTPHEVGIAFEEVAFTAADGTRIAGWWLDQRNTAPPELDQPDNVPGNGRTVIVCHGHRGSMADMLGIGPALWRAGNNVLLFDFRGNGDSGDGRQSLAHHEQLDLRAAIDWVVARRPGDRLAVMGFSMGAAVAAMVGPTDERVEALVLDSPFADMLDVVRTTGRRWHLPAFPLLAMVDRVTGWRHGYRFADVRPVDVIGRFAPRPLLLLHGDADRVIPLEHARRMLDAAGEPKQLVVFPGADHCGGYFQDRGAYVRLVSDWLAEHLPTRALPQHRDAPS